MTTGLAASRSGRLSSWHSLWFSWLLMVLLLLSSADDCWSDDSSARNSTGNLSHGVRDRRYNVIARYRDRGSSTRDDDVIFIEGVRNWNKVAAEAEGGLRRARRQATTRNEMELLLALDRTAYNRFLSRNDNDAGAARAEIDRYFAGVVKSVNNRLAKADVGTFSVRAILTEVYVLSVAESRMVTDDLDDDDDGIINSDIALDNFSHLADSLQNSKPHDYTLLVTGYDIRRGNGANVVGITYQADVCGNNNQGLLEEEGDEMISSTMAHEIGHTLAALHDDQQNDCQSAFFTMAAVAGVPSQRSQAFNPFTFSACSKSEIRDFLASSDTRCLRSRQTTEGSELDIEALTRVPLGQRYNADQQCRNSFGNGSRFCRALYDSSDFNFARDMCYNLRCELPSREGSCGGTLPFFGTSCGDRRWCVEGSCVKDSRAPRTPSPTCPQGDDPTANCSPSSCSNAQLREFECCATCSPALPSSSLPVSGVPSTTPIDVSATNGGLTSGPSSTSGVQPELSTTTGSGALSSNGAQPQTGTPTHGGITSSIFGIESSTAMRPSSTGNMGPTASIPGFEPNSATPGATTIGNAGPSASFSGFEHNTATPAATTENAGPSASFTRVETITTTGNAGPSASVSGVEPDTGTPAPTTIIVGSTVSIFGVEPQAGNGRTESFTTSAGLTVEGLNTDNGELDLVTSTVQGPTTSSRLLSTLTARKVQ